MENSNLPQFLIEMLNSQYEDEITQKIRHGATADEIREITPELDSMYEKVCNAIKS